MTSTTSTVSMTSGGSLTSDGILTVPVAVNSLARALTLAAPHALDGKDGEMLPSLSGVALSGHGGRLYAVATDRFSLLAAPIDQVDEDSTGSMAAAPSHDVPEFTHIIPRAEVKRILALLSGRHVGHLAAYFTFTPNHDGGTAVTVEFMGKQLRFLTVNAGFPKWPGLLSEGPAADSKTRPVTMNAVLLARFGVKVPGQKLGSRVTLYPAVSGRAWNVIVSDDHGTRVLAFGAIMPMRGVDDVWPTGGTWKRHSLVAHQAGLLD